MKKLVLVVTVCLTGCLNTGFDRKHVNIIPVDSIIPMGLSNRFITNRTYVTNMVFEKFRRNSFFYNVDVPELLVSSNVLHLKGYSGKGDNESLRATTAGISEGATTAALKFAAPKP
jgi:hypothetical protein